MDTPETASPPSPRSILMATAIAFVVAMAVLFVAILPAEFGSDPLGTGDALGLTALSRGANPLDAQLETHRNDRVEFLLEPFQSVEYKYTMDMETSMVFSWMADGDVYYDMHAEPAGLGEEYAESFEQGTGSSRMGTFHAPFTGIHGWFWENRGSRAVTISLNASGFFVDSTVFRDGSSFERVIDPIAGTE